MTQGWDWIEEGQRIAEDARQAGELDIDAIKASSIVFEGPLDALKYAEVEHQAAEPAPKLGGFVGDLADMARELENCRAGHCEAAYKQNSIGGEARFVVNKIAKIVDAPWSPPLDGNVWSPANMGRVIAKVQELVNEVEALRKNQPKTVAALREALTHLGEGV
ncbi:hypothetical protein MBT42_02475 [Streptomyces sp. MBT42]|uniref:hypothetical protein n=1 Tax=Streptomyces sp. MBT42 TaxID=1488373 RepID=UPI001E3B7239|nr:hypothetical protein [Streptomyces sp. MBT42]MCD2462424.1 hypothetical protein [Streptomyces sp. MBT42]